MGTLELKNIISQYMNTADDKVLQIVKAVFESYQKNDDNADFFNELPAEIQELLMESREDIKKGEFFTHEEVMKEVNQKYNIAG